MTDQEYKKIRVYVQTAMARGLDSQHSFDHVERVRLNALKIISVLKLKNIDLNLMQAACLLHDLPINLLKRGPLLSHIFENYAINKFLPSILKQLRISEKERHLLNNAISKHNFSFPYKRLNKMEDDYTKVLEDSDTIDLFSNARIKSLKNNKNQHLVFNFVFLYSSIYIKFGRKYLENYLNFPELAKINWYGK